MYKQVSFQEVFLYIVASTSVYTKHYNSSLCTVSGVQCEKCMTYLVLALPEVYNKHLRTLTRAVWQRVRWAPARSLFADAQF